jgi:hypothetical protein
MEKYWALDYVNGELSECELVYEDQLYLTEEEAEAAARATARPELFEVTWYSIADLREVYETDPIVINDKLQVVYK